MFIRKWFSIVILSIFLIVVGCTGPNSEEAPPSSTNTIDVPCSTTDLIAAINSANSTPATTDTINLEANCVYILEGLQNSDDGISVLPSIITSIVINGNGATLRLLQPQYDQPLRMINIGVYGDLTLTSLRLETDDYLFGWGNVTRDAGELGGAIINNGALHINDLYFFENRAYEGGAIYSTGRLTIENSTFEGNSGYNGGGAILSLGTADISTTTFFENFSFMFGTDPRDIGGGAIALMGGSLNVSDSVFDTNWAIGNLRGGAAIFNDHATLTIETSVFINNVADYYGGAIMNQGFTTISDSEFTGNEAYKGGALLHEEGAMMITHSKFTGNEALGGGAIYVHYQGILTLRSSLIADNKGNMSGALFALSETAITLENTTISQNTTKFESSGAVSTNGTITILYSTIANNLGASPGLFVDAEGLLTIENSLIANNSAGDCGFQGGINAANQNLDSDGSCTGFTITDDPLLGPLADNGGPTMTHALLHGSPALGAALGSCPATDQRLVNRPGLICDLGAYEDVSIGLQALPGNILKIEIGSDTLCLGGPDEAYLVIQTLNEGTQVDMVARGSTPGWFVVNSPLYKEATCWVPEEDVRKPIAPYGHLPVLVDPVLPVIIPTDTPQPQGCWVQKRAGPVCTVPCPDSVVDPVACTP